MICNIAKDIQIDSSQIKLRVTASLVALLLTVTPVLQSQNTKPSDVFFYDPAHPDQRGAPYNIGTTFAPLNKKPEASIVAKGVVLRGWLVGVVVEKNPHYADPCTKQGQTGCDTVFLGFEDVHYDLVLDYDFINSTYGQNAGVLNAAMLPGNPKDSQTIPISLADSGNRTQSGIGINSFWLPHDYGLPLVLHTELNAWHARGSQQCTAYNVPFAGNVGCDLFENYAARGRAPDGWVEREFGYASSLPWYAADSWWPFDPDWPDNLGTTDSAGNVVPLPLQAGDYVEVQGPLYQDIAHDAGNFWQNLTAGTPIQGVAGPPPPPLCWGQIYHNHDGWLEIHPVDSIKRAFPVPGRSPYDHQLESAVAGVKRVVPVMLCADANGATGNGSYPAYSVTVCPEQNYNISDPNSPLGVVNPLPPGRAPKPLVPNYSELIDTRFSTPQFISHSLSDPYAGGPPFVKGNSTYPDCVDVQAVLAAKPSARFKASYVVWWTPPPRGANLAHTTPGQLSGGPKSNATTSLQLLSATVCPTVDRKSCLSAGQARPPGALMDIVTVTSGGSPVAGATVSVAGQPTFTATTNANGVAVVTHLACFALGGVPRVGQTTVPVRTPVPCQATVTMTGNQLVTYQPSNITLP